MKRGNLADKISRERHDNMRKKKKRAAVRRASAAVCLLLLWKPHPAFAADLPPHLIQTVSEEDIYNGLLALGYLETAALEAPDCESAYGNVKDCIVQIRMENANGSGIIWELTEDYVVIATNRHVLDYWTEESGYVHFPQGFDMDAQLVGRSERFDVGFVAVDTGLFTYEELQRLRYARKETEAYEALEAGDEMFLVDAGSARRDEGYYVGSVQDKSRYIEDFGAEMLYGYCFAEAGMSGGGTFDGRGRLIGMTTGGTARDETASVPLPDLCAAYGEVVEGTVYDG